VIYILGTLSLLTGLVIGLAFPDLDLRTGFLGHRSIITHGVLLPLLLFWLAHVKKHITTRLLAVGVSLASAIHLCFDLFPRAWIGYALIDVPGYGRTSPVFSWLWIAVSTVGCMYLALSLLSSGFEVILVAGGLFVTFSFYATQESLFWSALVAWGVATAIALALPSDGGKKLKQLGRKLVS
jgi:hypothetical protein